MGASGEWRAQDSSILESPNPLRCEGFYSVFKRGVIGVYRHCSERHLNRYVAEFGTTIACGLGSMTKNGLIAFCAGSLASG
jgi:hypothetical protein